MKVSDICMRRKKLFAVVLSALMLAFALCGCGQSSDNVPDSVGGNTQQPGQTQSQQPTQGVTGNQGSGNGVDFGLQQAPDPNFNSPASGGNQEKMYTIQGDYAYEMDPNTLQPIGPPLDPITHQPVDNPVEGGGNPSTPNNPQDQPAESDPPASQPPAASPEPSAPAEENKLPNMGMFLEDD